MEFETTMYAESGTVVGTVLKDDPVLGVMFLDESGNAIWAEDF